jgi:hypothetical protein
MNWKRKFELLLFILHFWFQLPQSSLQKESTLHSLAALIQSLWTVTPSVALKLKTYSRSVILTSSSKPPKRSSIPIQNQTFPDASSESEEDLAAAHARIRHQMLSMDRIYRACIATINQGVHFYRRRERELTGSTRLRQSSTFIESSSSSSSFTEYSLPVLDRLATQTLTGLAHLARIYDGTDLAFDPSLLNTSVSVSSISPEPASISSDCKRTSTPSMPFNITSAPIGLQSALALRKSFDFLRNRLRAGNGGGSFEHLTALVCLLQQQCLDLGQLQGVNYSPLKKCNFHLILNPKSRFIFFLSRFAQNLIVWSP